MICPYCGFHNEAGDEFCGNCGKYLGFDAAKSGDNATATDAGAGAAGMASAASAADLQPAGVPGGDSPTLVQPAQPSPPPPPPPPIATGPLGPTTTGSAGWAGGPPDVICWNCGRRNPGNRAFCLQCGQKLTASAAAAGGAGGVIVPPGVGGAGGGGGRGRWVGIAAALLIGALVIGVGAVVFFGLLSGRPAPSGIAGASPSPSASASGLLPSGSFGVPSPTVPGATATALLTEPPPTDTPKPPRTPRPTCDSAGQPMGCKPTPTPSPTPTPTPLATPVSCAASTQATKSVTLTVAFPTRTVPDHFAWCVHNITFTNTSVPGATGTLKLYLENPEYFGPPGNYGMAKIGWPGPAEAQIASNFATSSQYTPLFDYPFGYDAITGGTIVSFQIDACGTNGTCDGSVTIEFERILAP